MNALEHLVSAGELEGARVCARCRRHLPIAAFVVLDRARRRRRRVTRWCPPCRELYKRERDERRRSGTNPRARHDAPRDRGTNPRAQRPPTNPHAGKSELTGQWRAAFRRLGRLEPERLHELELELEHALARYGPTPELAELERRIAGALPRST